MYGSQAPFFLALLLMVGTYLGGTTGQVMDVQENVRGIGVQGISWASCPTGGGDASVSNLNLDGCSSAGCTLKLYQRYPGNFQMRLARSQNTTTTAFTASNGANSVSLIRDNMNGTVQPGINYTVNVPLFFDSRFANSRTNNSHRIQVEVLGFNNQRAVCKIFTVLLNSFRVKNGTTYNQNCDFNNEPCAFANSLCKSGSCKCNTNSVENNNHCKLKVDKACSYPGDCLKNAECKSGLCKCQNGYKPNEDNDKCSSCSPAISFSVLLLALQQLFVFTRK
ncbi:unnamed protein product [Allacma fusca]|uniref:EGF-like domain-containing protein n=1 Tax=Allacma fusca TaxID=39272 RepID=A0A8J2L586_9HEXA|nr:unnamed protein product [Allacma fusca]